MTDYDVFMMDIYVCNPHRTNPMGHLDTVLRLPVTQMEYGVALDSIGIDETVGKDYYFDKPQTSLPGLGDKLPRITPDNFSELNYLALKLEAMSPQDRELLDAALYTSGPDSVAEIINTAENLACFDLHPAYSLEQYGEFLATMRHDYHASTICAVRAQFGDDPEFQDYLDDLIEHFDSDAYAQGRVMEEGGVFTPVGYVIPSTPIPVTYHGIRDIPPEHQIKTRPCVRVEDVNLGELVLQMHALGGHTGDAGYNLSILTGGGAEDFLLLATENKMLLTAAAPVYHRDSSIHKLLADTVEAPDTRLFALHIMGNRADQVTGNLTELDLAELQRDIAEHSISLEAVRATLKDGTDKIYTPQEWSAMEPIDRDRLETWTDRYSEDDTRKLQGHLRDARTDQRRGVLCLAPDEFLHRYNIPYMSKTAYCKPDLLRVDQQAATELLTREGTPVYRLLPNGWEKLAAMDAVRSGGLNYSDYRTFGINKIDMGDLDRWAQRTFDEHRDQQPHKVKPVPKQER